MLYETISSIATAAVTFTAAKVAYTQRLAALATKKNSGQPVSNADLTDLIVTFYNPMTTASNTLRGLIADTTALAGQFATAGQDVAAFDAVYGLHLNILCGLPNKADALRVIDLYANDLRAEVTSWFDLQSPVIADTSFTAEAALATVLGQTPVFSGWPPEVPAP